MTCKHKKSDDDCVAIRLTPQGRGAVAVIAVQGRLATARVARYFTAVSGKPLDSIPVNHILLGRWGQAEGCGEDVVVCRTSETSWEVNCHGGLAAAGAVISSLTAGGVVEQSPDSWAIRSRNQSIESAAWLTLAEARTEQTVAILLDQYRGALRRAIEGSMEDLTNGRSFSAKQRLVQLLARSDIGLHLVKPWRVVFAGPPNVGKSSLMNRLLGYRRAIVFDQPGTTRDVLSATTALAGWPMELHDTAGLRATQETLEAEGVSRTTALLADADLAVLVFDASRAWDLQQQQMREENPNALLVFNKCDLREVRKADANVLATSALTGVGVPELIHEIVTRVVPCELKPGDAVPFTQRQRESVRAACRAIDDGQLPGALTALKHLTTGHS